MTETRKAGWFVVGAIGFAVGFTAWDAEAFNGWTMLAIEAVILTLAGVTGFGSVRWWLAAVDATETGRHARHATGSRDRVRQFVGHRGDHGGNPFWVSEPAEDVVDTEESFDPHDGETGFFPFADEAVTDTLPAVREEAAR